VAITIRNQKTEELIRKIGRRTGEGPSAVVRRLVEREAKSEDPQEVSEAEVQRRIALFDELRKKYPDTGPKMTWAEIEEEMDSIFGEDLK
jgi:hypothetical protein